MLSDYHVNAAQKLLAEPFPRVCSLPYCHRLGTRSGYFGNMGPILVHKDSNHCQWSQPYPPIMQEVDVWKQWEA